ncbi:hypothetical protein I3842_03G252400 [Carya illinoinensis]|uniref:Alkyl transferase n=1 Tax=Carya illinoinensis TaxID=32201 RepID=A0A922FPP9_CARIL|nr:hypothetical protein I3842_03G252400 [Carya illinoinensis]
MEKGGRSWINCIFENLVTFLRRCIFYVLSVGPIPYHIAFIMDGNRRYAKKQNFMEGNGHGVGFLALLSMLKSSILMDLMQLKIEGLIKEESVANHYGVRVHFIANLKLLSEPVRLAAERAMLATANNSMVVLSVCVAYTSTNEIVHAVQKSCEQKWEEISILDASGSGYGLTEVVLSEKDERENLINLIVIEKHMYMTVAPDPHILIPYCSLYLPYVLWPEIGFGHFLWAILNFQRNHFYLEKRRKQL